MLDVIVRLWPLALAVVTIGVGYVRVLARVERLIEDVAGLMRRHLLLEERADNHEIDLVRLGERFASVHSQLDRVEAKLDRLIERS